MIEITINADIRARWINGMPSYRLWVDHELICERTFWPNPSKYCIKENFTVAVKQGKHKLILEQINLDYGTVIMNSVSINKLENNTETFHKIAADEFNKNQTLTFSV